MSILELSKISTSEINKIEKERPLSEWAAEFISRYKITRETDRSAEIFRNLTRSQKDAIRYQLRKWQTSPSSVKGLQHSRTRTLPQTRLYIKEPNLNWLSTVKIVLGFWISGFLLFDIAKIYITKGATPFMAWQSAILIEICIIFASLSTRPKLRRLAYFFFAYNILLFAVMEVDQLLAKREAVASSRIVLEEKQELSRSLKNQLKLQILETTNSLKRLDLDHARGFITSGSAAFEKVSNNIRASNKSLSEQIAELNNEILETRTSQYEVFWLYVVSLLYFLLRCVLQFYSIHLLDRRQCDI